MLWQTTPYTVPLLAAGLASFVIAAYVFSHRFRGPKRLVWTFLGVTLGAGVWSAAYAAQLSATTLEATLFWNRFVWLGVGTLAVAWPTFVLAYTERAVWFRPERLAAICLVPAAAVVAVWTLGVDPLFYRSPSLEAVDGGYLVVRFVPTAALLAFVAYSYVVNLITFLALGYAAADRPGVYRRQAALLLAAGVIPMAVGVLSTWSSLGPAFVDLTPLAFAVTAGIVAWVLFRYRLLDLSPVARRAVFENLDDGVVVLDGDDRVVDANDRALELFDPLEFGRPIEAAFAGGESVVDAVRRAESGEDGRATVDTEEGPRFLTVTEHALSSADPGGPDAGSVLLFRDVTEHETLQRRYRALIEKSPNVIAVCGTDGLFRYVSPSIDRLLGREAATIEGRPVLDLVHPEDRRESQRRFEAALETGETQVFEHRIAHENGDWRTFETTVEPLFENAADEVVITAMDVTEGRRHEQRLQVLNRVLRHDLKNDANVIGGYADLLRDHVDAEGREHLDVIDRKVEALTHLSDQAREIDVALHDEFDRAEIDLASLVPRLCDSLEAAFPDASVTLSTPERAVVSADELLESAVRNVLENAVVHHDGAVANIDVCVRPDDDGYRVEIGDDGPGIPPVERTVFSEGRETPLEHASGLGLWLVHWIVTGSGGELAIETREPGGTLVSMWFPADDGEAGKTDGDA
ncbi:histidine kinase N-terminal 7TM domain-containing protein [Halorubrum aethiopicum]|uniref:histidine kinase N-terminal 7TM domain-containing protein n=1 Tax=Halorubrum aethiopicum TaxID=1758255 RepID=UPI000833F475|nr:histidine kinase N-terminal 7TM domain-containing protein [Halorubrum aethiopicum]